MNKKRNKQKRGFTLIEMIIVFGLISVLAVILVRKYNTAWSSTQEVAEEQVQRRLNESVVQWMHLKMQSGDIGVTPQDLGDSTESAINNLKVPVVVNGKSLNSGLSDKITPEYVAKLKLEYVPAEGEFRRINP